MKNGTKTVLIAAAVVVLVAAAFLLGSSVGKKHSAGNSMPADNIQPENSQDGNENSSMSDNIFDLITAFDDYMDAAVQQAEVEMDFRFGSFEIDDEFSVRNGITDDVQINHIKRGKLDIYICDGQVFVEGDNAHFNINNTGKYDGMSIRQMFAIAYEIVKNGNFEVTAAGTETIYSVTLTQQQIESILNSFQSTMENTNVNIENGVLKITVENGKLDEFDIICSGYTEILSARVEGGIVIETDLSVSEQPIELPAAVKEQVK